jgi:serine/threonine-protein kinase
VKICPVCGSEYGDEAAFCSRDRSPLRPSAPDAANTPGLVGQLVGDRYQVERRIGEGGMGEVYLARHVLIGRACALKVLSPQVSQDPDAVIRFNREATNASRISHPNVCAVYDFGLTADGLVYLAMEYVEGRTLNELMEETGPMPVARAMELVAQCGAGLAAAHELGIIHRDLKPENVMVTGPREGRAEGEHETAKLVDFGIAKALTAEPGQQVTKSGFVVGTPDYMSPEQLAGDPLDPRSDQYALALVFYRLITGHLPFEGTSARETLVKRLTEPPRPLAAARPGARFPPGLQGVMDRALARRPVDRYPSVTAFVGALQETIAGAASDAVPTRRLDAAGGRGYDAIPPTRRAPATKPRRGSRVAAAAAAMVILGGGSWAVSQLGHPASARKPTRASDSAARGLLAETTGTAISRPAPPPAATPSPAAPPRGQPSAGAKVAKPGGTLVLPRPEQLDSPATREWALRAAYRILNASSESGRRRAQAAVLLGDDGLRRKDRRTALQYFQRAYELSPDPKWQIMIRRLQDSTPP